MDIRDLKVQFAEDEQSAANDIIDQLDPENTQETYTIDHTTPMLNDPKLLPNVLASKSESANDDFEPVEDDPYEGSEARYLFKAKKTQIEMVIDRGYIVPDHENPDNIESIFHMTTLDFIEYYKNPKNATFPEDINTFREKLGHEYVNPQTHQKLMVYYPDVVQGGKKVVKDNLDKMFQYILKRLSSDINICIISKLPPSNDLKDTLKDKLPAVNTIQYFLYSELQFNPTKHYLVPKHEFASQSEINNLKINYCQKRGNTNLTMLPTISINDPIARYFGAKAGNVMKIHRTNIAYSSIISSYIIFRYVRDVPLEEIR